MAEMAVTDNGLRVVVESIPGSAVTSTGIWFNVGSRHESNFSDMLSRGIAHLTEHMILRGGSGVTADEMSSRVDLMGSDFNAETERDFTAYWGRTPSQYAEEALELLLDSVMAPRMAEGEFPAEISAILDEINSYEHNPEERAMNMLFERVLWDSPLAMSVGGSREEFRASATPEAVLDFWRRWYSPERAVVVVAGDVEMADVLCTVNSKVAEHKGWLENARGQSSPYIPHIPKWKPDFIDVRDDSGRTYAYLGVRGVPFSSPLYYPILVLSSILGDGVGSRANRIIRQKHGLAYSTTSSHQAFSDDGMFVLEASSDQRKNAEAALEIMRSELTKIALYGVSQDELKAARRSLANEILMGDDGTFPIMYRLGYGMTAAGWEAPVSADDIAERIMSVDATQVLDAASLLEKGTWYSVKFTEGRD
ncbi:pitrilysin family protein [uncultured Rothia sp.]|uniref:M16 family metallopeptidase n=1 Tax=uncultured Rothia sp. TaxID=316088 RepID=UPI0028DB5B0D|nr:pitrilysin family protein [uncultured Rothia sp.]